MTPAYISGTKKYTKHLILSRVFRYIIILLHIIINVLTLDSQAEILHFSARNDMSIMLSFSNEVVQRV